MNIERRKRIKYLLIRCKSLRESMLRTLSDSSVDSLGRYVGYKRYAEEYAFLAYEVSKLVNVAGEGIAYIDTSKIKNWGDTTWPQQKEIIDSLVIYVDSIIALMERESDFAEEEYTDIENFIKTKLRSCFFQCPQTEKDVQNAIETLFIGRGWGKGIDYDRETGKIEFSGKEFIPDFIVTKLEMCIEVKLIKEDNKSRIIEQINADIPAYSKDYKRILFIVYDLGCIRDEIEFRRDIENAKDGVKVIVVKN